MAAAMQPAPAGSNEIRELEGRLAALARGQAPLRRALARLAGRLVAIRGWERLGFVRLADFARERLGLSGRQLQDLAHVDAALARLPAVEAAFLNGALSWSKARLLCRVAEPGDEATWVAFARRVPVRALEREVRTVDRGALEYGALAGDEDGARAYPRETIDVRCSGAVNGKWWRAQQLARQVAGERLTRWECMEAVVGEVLSAAPGIAAGAESGAGGEARAPVPSGEARGTADVCADQGPLAHGDSAAVAADVCAGQSPATGSEAKPTPAAEPEAAALPVFLLPLVAGLEHADAFALDARLRRVVALEQRSWAEAGALLARASAERLHVAAGFTSFEGWARECLGVSPRKTRALLRLERAGDVCPALRAAYRDGRLSWVQAHALVPLVVADETVPWREGWITHAQRVSVRRLEEDVDRALSLGTLRPPSLEAGDRQTCAPARDLEEPPEPAGGPSRFFFTAPREDARWFRALLCSVRRRLERATGRLPSEGEAVGVMLDHAIEAWTALIPNDSRWRREHAVFARDGWRCTAPGCSSYRNLHDHHVVFRSAGGSDELVNRTTLCAAHHLRGVHAGAVRCTGSAPDGLVFELGIRADGPPLASFCAGDVRMA